ncbi:hypothetical protein NKH18_31290 [Streptomyces sp. M10(2022)]
MARGRVPDQGNGPELTLRKAGPAALGADPEPGDNQREADFRTENTADFTATGAEARGAVGETVTATVGFRNEGPAWIGNIRSGEPVAVLDLTVPEGAEVTGKPDSCQGVTAGGEYREKQLGAPRYVCETSMTVRDGARTGLPFDLKITELVPARRAGSRSATPGSPIPSYRSTPSRPTTRRAWSSTPRIPAPGTPAVRRTAAPRPAAPRRARPAAPRRRYREPGRLVRVGHVRVHLDGEHRRRPRRHRFGRADGFRGRRGRPGRGRHPVRDDPSPHRAGLTVSGPVRGDPVRRDPVRRDPVRGRPARASPGRPHMG